MIDQQTFENILRYDDNAAAIVKALQGGVRSTEQLMAMVPHPETFVQSMNLLVSTGIIGPPE